MESDSRLAAMILARAADYFSKCAEGETITTAQLISGMNVNTSAALRECLHLRDDGYIEASPMIMLGPRGGRAPTIDSHVEEVSLMEISSITAKGRKRLDQERLC